MAILRLIAAWVGVKLTVSHPARRAALRSVREADRIVPALPPGLRCRSWRSRPTTRAAEGRVTPA